MARKAKGAKKIKGNKMLPFNANKRKGASVKRLFATFKPYGEQ